jgi:hypothetical protein
MSVFGFYEDFFYNYHIHSWIIFYLVGLVLILES